MLLVIFISKKTFVQLFWKWYCDFQNTCKDVPHLTTVGTAAWVLWKYLINPWYLCRFILWILLSQWLAKIHPLNPGSGSTHTDLLWLGQPSIHWLISCKNQSRYHKRLLENPTSRYIIDYYRGIAGWPSPFLPEKYAGDTYMRTNYNSTCVPF